MTLFRNKYRAESIRLRHWDYSSDGYYFVTICTKYMENYFGEIKNGTMGLNELGCLVAKCWKNIPSHFPHTKLDAWVVMPNHVHGIVIMKNDSVAEKNNIIHRRDAINRVSTGELIINKPAGGITGKHDPMGKKTLGEIIRWLKGRCSFEIHKKYDEYFTWQTRFYDHIICNEKSLNEIREYIQNNPEKWDWDRNNPNNLWM